MRTLLALLCMAIGIGPAVAGDAKPLAEDEAVEQRMIAIAQDLRCLVCQNESLAGSRAPLAEDLRREVRGLIRQGKSDKEIKDFLVERYGNFVLYRPPLEASTLLLWGSPFVFVLGGAAGLLLHVRRRSTQAETPLDAAQRMRAEKLIADVSAKAPK